MGFQAMASANFIVPPNKVPTGESKAPVLLKACRVPYVSWSRRALFKEIPTARLSTSDKTGPEQDPRAVLCNGLTDYLWEFAMTGELIAAFGGSKGRNPAQHQSERQPKQHNSRNGYQHPTK
jgi:hypothetical protein